MATYRAPGAYARFVKAATPVATPSEVRALAIIGTGEISYDVVNEAVQRGKSGIADLVEHPGIYKVTSITSRPLYMSRNVTGSVVYVQGEYKQLGTAPNTYWDVDGGHYAIVDKKYIVWKKSSDVEDRKAKIEEISYDGSSTLASVLTVTAVNAKDYLLTDATYRIEVTYVGATDGMYMLIKEGELKDEIIGEFTVGSAANTKAVPGLSITLATTAGPPPSGTNDASLNDYVRFKVTAPKVANSVTLGAPPVTTNLPTNPSSYYIAYSYEKDPSEFKPKVFYSYEDVVTEYGNYEITASGQVINSLALGAEIALLNGAMPIVCVQVERDASEEYKTAIDSLASQLLGLRNVNSVVALSDHLSTHNAINLHLKQHVETMSLPQDAKERMAYLTPSPSDTLSILTERDLPVVTYGSERTVFLAPGGATKDIKDIKTGAISTKTLSAAYLAVAVASIGLKNDPAEPLTNKIITGFKNLSTFYTESQMNQLAESGCLVLKQDLNDIRIRHGITTSNADINSSEITLVQIKDYVMSVVRTQLGTTYIGNKMRPTIIGDIESTLISILNGFQARSIILGYNGVTVKRSAIDVRQVDIQFEIEAVYPLNYIDVTFSFSGVN